MTLSQEDSNSESDQWYWLSRRYITHSIPDGYSCRCVSTKLSWSQTFLYPFPFQWSLTLRFFVSPCHFLLCEGMMLKCRDKVYRLKSKGVLYSEFTEQQFQRRWRSSTNHEGFASICQISQWLLCRTAICVPFRNWGVEVSSPSLIMVDHILD